MNLNFLPVKVRGIVYGVATVLGIIDSAALAGYAKIAQQQPTWLQFADGALAPVLAVAGVVAISHLSTNGNSSLAEHPDVIAYQTPSGLQVAGEASPIPTGTPVTVQAEDDGEQPVDDIASTVDPTEEYPAWDPAVEPEH